VQKQIDETDAKILKILLKESRTSFTEIAKNCKVSVSAVRARYNRLRKLGIIKGQVMMVNPHSLGYNYICTIEIAADIEKESEVREFLENKQNLSPVSGAFGQYHLLVGLRNIQDLNRIQEELEDNPSIKHVDPLIWAETLDMDHPENLVIKPLAHEDEQKPPQSKDTRNYEVRIDETDRQIARTLSQNSRTPFRKIADQLDISTKNVIQRYRRLRENVLTLSSISVDLEKLGFKAMANLRIKAANKSQIPDIRDRLLQIPNLIVIVRYIGTYDLIALVVLSEFKELFRVKESARRIQGIENMEFFLTPIIPVWPSAMFSNLL